MRAKAKKTKPAPALRKRPAKKREIFLKPVREIVTQAPVSESKFYISPAERHAQPIGAFNEPPKSYGKTRLVLQIRDPYWGHVYWDIAQQTIVALERRLNSAWNDMHKILRVYDVTGIDFNGHNAQRSFDITLNNYADNWYIELGLPNRTYCVDIGVIDRQGRFIGLARSNFGLTPRDGVSDVIDEEWMSLEFDKLYRASGAGKLWGSSPGIRMREKMGERLLRELFSGAVSSFSRPSKK